MKMQFGWKSSFNNDHGSTMLFTLLIMVLLTVMGLAAINTTSIETMISGAEAKKRSAFYAAESGVEHAASILRSLCVTENQAMLQTCAGQQNANTAACMPKWTFALKNSTNNGKALSNATTPVDDSENDKIDWIEKFSNGASWIVERDLGNGYSYTVRVWNNNDGGGATVDTDSIIMVGAVATGPNNTRAAIEVALQGSIDEESASATYTAQAGAGAGKNYNAADVNAISGANLSGLSSMATP